MKKLMLLSLIMGFLLGSSAFGQELSKLEMKEINKQAKKYTKEGYQEFKGDNSIKMQLIKFAKKRNEEDDRGNPKYVTASGVGVGKTQPAAQALAIETAKATIAGLITNEIKSKVNLKIVNDQIDTEQGESLTKLVSGSVNEIITELPYVRPGFLAYKKKPGNQIEVTANLYYNAVEANEAAKRALQAQAKKEMEAEADELIDEINRLLDR